MIDPPNDRGLDGIVLPGVNHAEGHPVDWVEIQPGWGQQPQLRHIQWASNKEFEVRVVDAPVVLERIGHPNRPRPKNHGGHGQ